MKSIKDELNSNPNGFKYETLTTDANIRKSVDDIVYGAYGEDNPHPLEWYSSNNTKAAISPEQYLSEERNKIMREYAKNPFGTGGKEADQKTWRTTGRNGALCTSHKGTTWKRA